MKVKKWIAMLGIAVTASVAISTFTACNQKDTDDSSNEQISSDNSGNNGSTVNESAGNESTGKEITGTRMNAEMNLDLTMFVLYGRPLGDWTYEELEGFISSNFEEDPNYGTGESQGMEGRFYLDPINYNHAIIVEERNYIQLDVNGVTYSITNTDRDNEFWNIWSNNPGSGDPVSAICGQSAAVYLESVCLGLYERLQEENTIVLSNGMAIKDNTERISLCLQNGNLELYAPDGAITTLGVLFLKDKWQSTTDAPIGVVENGFGQNLSSALDLNLGQYYFLGRSLDDWEFDELLEYIRNTYEPEPGMEDQEVFIIGEESAGDRIWINDMGNGTLSIDIYYNCGVTVSVNGGEYRGVSYNINCDESQSAKLEELGGAELAALFCMTPREYLETLKPGLYDTLIVDENMPLGNSQDGFESICLYNDGGLCIQTKAGSITLSAGYEDSLIHYVSFWVY